MTISNDHELLLWDPVQRLPGVVDAVLIEIGKVFRDSRQGDRGTLSDAKEKLQQELPSRQNELHMALDDIEVEVLEAKAILEHKLAALRAAQASQQEATPAFPALGLEEELPADDLDLDLDLPQPAEASMATVPQGSTSNETLVADESAPLPMDSQLSAPSSTLASMEVLAQANDMLDMTAINADIPQNEAAHIINDSTDTDIDFQSMFPSESSKDMVFDLDFSGGASGTADLLANDTFTFAADTAEPGDAAASTSSAPNGEMTSLLPDLEGYVPVDAGGTTATDLVGFDTTKETGEDLSMLAEPVPMDPVLTGGEASTNTTFGDLFGETDLAGDGDMPGEMEELGAFDEEWFKSL